MNGELVSGGRENLRVLVDYKGSGFPGGQMQDDLLLFSLRPDASPNPLALAVVNFPPIRGKRSLYIHRLSGEAPEDRDVLLDAIEAFARRQGYPVLYLNVMELLDRLRGSGTLRRFLFGARHVVGTAYPGQRQSVELCLRYGKLGE